MKTALGDLVILKYSHELVIKVVLISRKLSLHSMQENVVKKKKDVRHGRSSAATCCLIWCLAHIWTVCVNTSLMKVTIKHINLNLIYCFDFFILNFKPIQYVRTEFHIVILLCDTLTACKSELAACLVSDACTNDPCLNGGTCTERNGHVHCLCLPTYAGDFCQTGELVSVVLLDSLYSERLKKTYQCLIKTLY